MSLFVVSVLAILASLWSAVCRIHKMSPRTSELVFWSHALLALALFAALFFLAILGKPVPAMTSLALGICSFLLAGALRWRHGPPPDTAKPTTLRLDQLHRVNGGKG